MGLLHFPERPEHAARLWNHGARRDFQDTVPTMPAPLGCTGNCCQGRACTCETLPTLPELLLAKGAMTGPHRKPHAFTLSLPMRLWRELRAIFTTTKDNHL